MDPVTEARVQRGHRTAARATGSASSSRTGSPRCAAATRSWCWPTARSLEAGPLRDSARFAELLASSHAASPVAGAAPVGRRRWPAVAGDAGAGPTTGRRRARPPTSVTRRTVPRKADPPPLPPTRRPPGPCGRSSGWPPTTPASACGAVALFLVMVLLGLDGSVLPLALGRRWSTASASRAVAGGRHRRPRWWSSLPMPYYTSVWFPEWWVRQMLRISLRLVHGQTGPRRVSRHTPAEVVAQGGDTERVVHARRQPDRPVRSALFILVTMTLVAGSRRAGAVLRRHDGRLRAGRHAVRPAAGAVRPPTPWRPGPRSPPRWSRRCRRPGRSSWPAPPGRCWPTWPALDPVRSDRQRREIADPGVGPVHPVDRRAACCRSAAWALYLAGRLSAGATLVAVVHARRGPLVRVDHRVAGLAAARRPGSGPAGRWR